MSSVLYSETHARSMQAVESMVGVPDETVSLYREDGCILQEAQMLGEALPPEESVLQIRDRSTRLLWVTRRGQSTDRIRVRANPEQTLGSVIEVKHTCLCNVDNIG